MSFYVGPMCKKTTVLLDRVTTFETIRKSCTVFISGSGPSIHRLMGSGKLPVSIRARDEMENTSG